MLTHAYHVPELGKSKKDGHYVFESSFGFTLSPKQAWTMK